MNIGFLLELEAVGDLPAKMHRLVHQVLQLQMKIVYLELLLEEEMNTYINIDT